MIRILDRLVAGTFLKLFVTFLLASPWLFIVGDLTENLDTYIDRGLTSREVAQAYLYQLPLYLQWSFPIAALIASVFTVHSMTTHSEVVAAKAGGISFHRLVRPILLLGLLLTGVALGLSQIVPIGNRISAQILRDEDPRRSWRTKFVYESENGLTWQIDRLTASDGRMTDVIVEQPASPDAVGIHVIAGSAYWDQSEGWTFQRGYLRRLLPDSTEQTYQFDELKLAGIGERPDELLELPREPEEMTYAEITRMARMIERTGGDARELLTDREEKISIPVATLVVILFGLPLATSSRRGGTAYGIGVSLGTVILYMVLLRLSGALGQAGTVSPQVAGWTPNVVFMAAAIVLLARVRT
ncbi:MAG TPA: LptF/LptG family permease [Longimicrobiales bacterium]|nr:LptF/LptG family permease [Longimicrobiales bacterium]